MEKRIIGLFVGLIGLILQSCEGPVGPQGVPGQDGGLIVGEAFEVEIDFTEENAFGEIFDLTPPMEEGDAVLIYMAEISPIDENRNAWRLLPQTFYLEDGILVYNFDYTPDSFSIFMDDSPIDFFGLDPYWTDNLIFRVVILPADLQNVNGRMDFSDYDATMKYLDIQEDDFIRLQK